MCVCKTEYIKIHENVYWKYVPEILKIWELKTFCLVCRSRFLLIVKFRKSESVLSCDASETKGGES